MGRPGNEIDRERHRTLRRREKEGEGTEEVCIYIYIPDKERGQEADEVESFKRLRTRGSRCELGWRVCGIGVMGQLVSYRGSSVRGTERYSGRARRHRARVARRKREIYIYTVLFLGVVCPFSSSSSSSNLCIHAEDIRAGTRNRRLISRTRSADSRLSSRRKHGTR